MSCRFNLIVLTETRFSVENSMDVVGYTGHHVSREGGAGGGVSIYSDPSLHAQKLNHLSLVNENIETCVIKIKTNQSDIIIVAIYRTAKWPNT